ncbi:MAG TPA: HAD family hydrolase [Hyphomicrobiaceae bacterium]|jgi:phosphoglycolate phosphatase
MAIRGILFDKDGTIIDYWRTWVPINRAAALYAASGDAAVADALLRLGGHDPATDCIMPGSPLAAGDAFDVAEAFASHPGIAPADRLVAGIDRIFCTGGAQGSALISGAGETLAELKRRGFRIGLATNDSSAGLEASLASHGILPLFDFTAGCDAGFGSKPDPRMVQGFCVAVGLGRDEIAMVGDAPHDLVMGRAAGVAINVGVLSGTSRRQDLAALADLIVDSINDLPARPQFHRTVHRTGDC